MVLENMGKEANLGEALPWKKEGRVWLAFRSLDLGLQRPNIRGKSEETGGATGRKRGLSARGTTARLQEKKNLTE